MSQEIKQIGNESIDFCECDIENIKLLVSIIAIFATIIASLLFVYTPPPFTTEDISMLGSIALCIIMGIVLSTFITLFISLMVPKSWITYPGYRVYISGRSGSDCERYIYKVSSEADQIAICKAAKELELKAQDFDAHAKELERIAAKCK